MGSRIIIMLLFFTAVLYPRPAQFVRGWNILSDDQASAEQVIKTAADRNINHLQLSHQLVMNLKDLRNPERAAAVNELVDLAHQQGIEEVTVWDHALYHLNYYPKRFRSGPDSTLDLDNPEFWSWLKGDYRELLGLVPNIDGIILTFIETGAHIEDQYSQTMASEAEKLAALVDTLAGVIIDEHALSLTIRTFTYTRSELDAMLNCLNLIRHPDVRVMNKEVPHDFFLTHPPAEFVADIRQQSIIEFDAAHEYNGQGIIAGIFPGIHAERWKYYLSMPRVKGYVARTDRFNNTSIIGTPCEINVYTLKRIAEDPSVSVDQIYDEFIVRHYGEQALPYLKPAFKNASDIISSSLYTLGLTTTSHSRLDPENDSAYQRHVSGKWLEPPVIRIGHGVNQEFHYWKDIVNHLAPAWYKSRESNQLAKESEWVLETGWLTPGELMNEEWLEKIITEKQYGVRLAEQALEQVRESQAYVTDRNLYNTTLHLFERTLLTARLHAATSQLYYSYRIYARGKSFRSKAVKHYMQDGLQRTRDSAAEILVYPHKGPTGQYDWEEDAYRALMIHNGVRYRQHDRYTRSTFPKMPYQGISGEKRLEILNQK
ncbi:MAG: hypothetical protein U5R06_19730 [candidate division KSB1 bacterium]|nr:hypothetical protein [candidate division KSB1 bacterium]